MGEKNSLQFEGKIHDRFCPSFTRNRDDPSPSLRKTPGRNEQRLLWCTVLQGERRISRLLSKISLCWPPKW